MKKKDRAICTKKYKAVIREFTEDGDKMDCLIEVVCESATMADTVFKGAVEKIRDTFDGEHKVVSVSRTY